jgi:IS1 family transposase
MTLYRRVKRLRSNITAICTDANSCYALAFQRHGVPEKHIVTKAETHLIESSNSSIRDNLARFNRRSKRFSKTLPMLSLTLDLFFHAKQQEKLFAL